MTPLIAAILGGLLFALSAAFLFAPLATIIPTRMERQWALEVEEHALAKSNQSTPNDYSYTAVQKALLACFAGLVGYLIVATFGIGPEGIALMFYYLSLLLLVAININSSLLPDVVVLPTLWLGLLYYAHAGAGAEHTYGAAIGYLAPFLVMITIKAFTSKEAIGRGDLKAAAMAGAWFGTVGLPLFFAGFIAGLFAWLVLSQFSGKRVQSPLSTGPAHLAGALLATFGARVF